MSKVTGVLINEQGYVAFPEFAIPIITYVAGNAPGAFVLTQPRKPLGSYVRPYWTGAARFTFKKRWVEKAAAKALWRKVKKLVRKIRARFSGA